MKFAVLGPLEVYRGTASISVGSPMERRLLAALALQHGRVVSTESLSQAVWDGPAPESAARTLNGYVVHLQHAFGSEGESLITSEADGYRLDIAADDLDSARFEALIGRARTALAGSDPVSALEHFDEALALWRGTPYQEFPDIDVFRAESERLLGLHRYAIEARNAAHLDLGGGAELVPELEALVREYPLSEELWAQLMVAQFRAGRQTEALASYSRVSKMLSDELGVEPGPHLRDVQLAVLTHDPRLIGPYTSTSGSTADHEPPFVGREADLYTLRSAWLETQRGHGRIVVVSASGGYGKTRLIEEFAREVRAAGGNVARARRARTPDPLGLLERLGSPLLIVIDEPMTAIPADLVRDLPTMIVIGVDPESTPMHVLSGLVGADLMTLGPLNHVALERVAEWAGNGQLPRTVITDIAATVDGNPATAMAEARAAVAAQNNAARVLAVADTAAARSDLDNARERLTQSLLLSRTQQIHRTAADQQPWLGLRSYTAAEHGLFHGRDHLVADVLARLAELNRVTLVGPSGSGKSSTIAAGVLPALANGALPTSQIWQQHTIRAGDVIERLGRENLVVVDQAEEIWTLLDDTDRNEFIAGLEASRLRGAAIILALRSDFLDRCSADPRLSDIVRDSIVLVPNMADDEVRSIVTEPARLFGAEVDAGVIDSIVHEMRHDPNALPQVSTALALAWQQHDGSRVTERDFNAGGGVAGAIEHVAEQSYSQLSPAGQDACRTIFSKLTTVGAAGVVTGRHVTRDEIDDSAAADEALNALTQAQLIAVDSRGIDVAHESLLGHWPRLTEWLQPDSTLTSLSSAPDSAANPVAIEPATQTTDKRVRRSGRGTRVALILMSVLLVLALLAAGFAWRQRSTAIDARQTAIARQLLAESANASSLERSLLLAVAAYQLAPDAVTQAGLTNALIASSGLVKVIHPGGGRLLTVAATSNGKALVTGGASDTLYTYNTATFAKQTSPALADAGIAASVARPGHNDQIAVSGVGNASEQTPVTLIWDITKDRQTPLPGVVRPLASMAWTTDGSWLVGAQDVGAVLAWSAAHPTAAPVRIPGNSSRFRRVVSIDTDRVIVFEQNDVATVWQLPADGSTTATQVTTFNPGSAISAVAASPDGKYFAVGHGDGSVTVWDTASLSPIATNTSDTSIPSTLVFTVDGHRVIAGRVDGSLAYIATLDGTLLSQSRAHDGQVTGLAVGPGGQRLYSTGADGTVMVWRTDGATGITSVLKPTLPAGFEADGILVANERVAETSPSGILASFAAKNPSVVDTMNYDANDVMDTRISMDGLRALQAYYSGFAKLSTIATSAEVQTYSAPGQSVTMAGLSPDGKRVALALNQQQGTAGSVAIYDAKTGAVTTPMFDVITAPGVLAWSPDNTRVAVGSWQRNETGVYDAKTGKRVWKATASSLTVAWTPDGKYVITGGDDGVTSVLDANTGKVVYQDAGVAGVDWVSPSADSTSVAVTDSNNHVHVIDLRNFTLPAITIGDASVRGVFGSAHNLYVGLATGTVRVYDLGSANAVRQACSMVGSSLTTQEWRSIDAHVKPPAGCKQARP